MSITVERNKSGVLIPIQQYATQEEKIYKRFDVWYADLGENKNSRVMSGMRPVLIISNNKNNQYSPIVLAVPLTSSITKKRIPVHVPLTAQESGLKKDSTILFEQHLTLDKSQLIHKFVSIPESYHGRLQYALNLSTSGDYE